MKLVYIGPHSAVMVPLPLGGEAECKHGEPMNLPDSLCEGLLEQPSNWRKAKDAKGDEK